VDPFYIVQTFDDFDDFTESSTWDLEFAQLSPGQFRADLSVLGALDIQVGEISYNRAMQRNEKLQDCFYWHWPLQNVSDHEKGIFQEEKR
jgi:hypothetical protein